MELPYGKEFIGYEKQKKTEELSNENKSIST
jgi:hypothetical protein